jgi:heat shock protein HtpX
VLAHEISHIGNRDILISSVAAAIATGITYVAYMAQWAAIFGGGRDRDNNPIALIAMALLAPMAAAVLQMALSRSREYEADRTGARLIGTGDPLARALEKLGGHHGTGSRPTWRPEQASAYIANPLAGQKTQRSLRPVLAPTPPWRTASPSLRDRSWA